MNFKEFLYFSLFSSISAALNIIQISYGRSYFRHRDSSDIITYDIARQSVVDKWSGKFHSKSGKSQEKSGNLFSHFWWEPCIDSACSVRHDVTCGVTQGSDY